MGMILMASVDKQTLEEFLETIFEAGLRHMGTVSLAYHNLNHVTSMLDAFCNLAKTNEVFRRVYSSNRLNLQIRLAIAWHDAVYVIGAPKGQNEKLSADMFKASIQADAYARYPELRDHVIEIEQLIMATAEHFTNYRPKSEAECVLMDLDVLNFSWESPQFLAASREVETEARQRFTEEQVFDGRYAFFKSIKGFCYHVLNGEYQRRANRNINLMLGILGESSLARKHCLRISK